MCYAISTLITSIKPGFLECFVVEMLLKFLGWFATLLVNLVLEMQAQNKNEVNIQAITWRKMQTRQQ
jgi:hypothetical protein